MLSHVGHSLGVFEAGRVHDLGLPPLDETATPAVPGESSVKVPGPHSSLQVQKFHLGETLSVVPACIAKRVLRGNYVDIDGADRRQSGVRAANGSGWGGH